MNKYVTLLILVAVLCSMGLVLFFHTHGDLLSAVGQRPSPTEGAGEAGAALGARGSLPIDGRPAPLPAIVPPLTSPAPAIPPAISPVSPQTRALPAQTAGNTSRTLAPAQPQSAQPSIPERAVSSAPASAPVPPAAPERAAASAPPPAPERAPASAPEGAPVSASASAPVPPAAPERAAASAPPPAPERAPASAPASTPERAASSTPVPPSAPAASPERAAPASSARAGEAPASAQDRQQPAASAAQGDRPDAPEGPRPTAGASGQPAGSGAPASSGGGNTRAAEVRTLSQTAPHALKNIELSVSGQKAQLRIEAEDPFPCRAFVLSDPPRQVIDLPGSWQKMRAPAVPANRLVKGVRIGIQDKGPRLVLDMDKAPSYEISRPADGVVEIAIQ
ncbi:MAG: AMIN domain-containing protein [Deltaproteobacteria bacterium]|nr:AMIN domain-containing protein [Deltaproteobacteria bacterium]